MTTEANTTEPISIDLKDGQTLSEYLRDISEKGKEEYVKDRADDIVRECLPYAKKGELKHDLTRSDAIAVEVIEYLESHGVKVTDETSRLGKTYRYVLSWEKPKEEKKEKNEEEEKKEKNEEEEKKDEESKTD